MRLAVSLSLTLLLLSSVASAQPTMDPDTEVARREYGAGAALYESGKYELALEKFRAAEKIDPSPDFDYNIARCLDRLGRWQEAADSYERFVQARPDAPETAGLRERIRVLRARAPSTPSPPPAAPSSPSPPKPPPNASRATTPALTRGASSARRLRLAAWIVGAGALGLAAAGAGVYGSAYSDYAARRDACQGRCSPASLTGLRSTVESAQIGSGVLFGLAGAALIADVVLWTLSSRAHSPTRAALDLSNGTVRF